MKEQKKRGGKNRSALGRDGVSLHSSVGCNAQYSTSIGALQEEVTGNFFPKKKRSLLLGEMYGDLGLTGRRVRVDNCGTFLEFRVAEQEKRLHAANFCRDRFCPMCNWRRSLKIFGQVSQIMNILEARGYRFLFLTLTVRNCKGQDFSATVQGLYDGWRKLYHVYFCKNKALKGVILGTFRALETTINKKTGEFHPHLHVILAVLPGYFRGQAYVKQERWAEMWREACGLDYKPIVDIRTVKPKEDKRTGEMSMAGAVAEVAKYAVKDDDYLTATEGEELNGQLNLSGADRTYYLRVLMEGLSGRRLVDMTGCFREVKKQLGLDDAEDGDLVHVDEEMEIREDVAYLIVRYRWRNGVYVESVQRPGEMVPDEPDEPPIPVKTPKPKEDKPPVMGRCSICGSVLPKSEFPFWSRQKCYCRECVQNWDKL